MGGGGQSGGSSTTTTVQQLSPEQRKLIGLAMPTFQSYFDENGQAKAGPYQGQTQADTSPYQSLAQMMTLDTAFGPAQEAANSLMSGTNFLTSGKVLDPSQNPGLQGTLDYASRGLTDAFTQSILPNIRDEAILAGGYGGSGQKTSQQMAADTLERNIGGVQSGILNTNYQAGLDSMTKALAFGPASIQAGFAPATAVSAVGDTQQAQQQAQINDLVSRYYKDTFFPLSLAEEIAGIGMGLPGGSASSTSTSNGASGGGGVAGGLQGALGGAALGTSFLPGWGTAAGGLIGGLLGMFS